MRFTHIIASLLVMAIFSTVCIAGTTTSKAVNLNQATVKELVHINGLTKYKARAIVAYRKKHGQFGSLGDLRKVKGFKRVKQDKMQLITSQLKV